MAVLSGWERSCSCRLGSMVRSKTAPYTSSLKDKRLGRAGKLGTGARPPDRSAERPDMAPKG